MSILNTNKLTWFKNGGEPLKSGYVYVGQAGLNPQEPANQKTVTFTDSQGNEFTATQPLRTDTNGRVQWNGKAIIATVEGDYSLLLLDSNQTQIEAGWTPTVEGANGGTTDLGDYREYALTLADVKQIDLSPGRTIGSVGKLSATDGAGSDWLVVSPTGGTADDVDLVDFDNGLQGERINNAAEYAGYIALPTRYISPDGIDGNSFDVDANITINTYQSIGPTGSGADQEWTALDSLPSGYKAVDIAATNGISGGSATSGSPSIKYRQTGSSETGQPSYPRAFISLGAGDQNVTTFSVSSMMTVPCDAAGRFDIWYDDSNASIAIDVAGFYK